MKHVEYHQEIGLIRHGKCSVHVEPYRSDSLCLVVNEVGRDWQGKFNCTTGAVLAGRQILHLVWAIEMAVRLARSTEMFDGHPVWCDRSVCEVGNSGKPPHEHSVCTGELDITDDTHVDASLYRRKDGAHRVGVYVTSEPIGGDAMIYLPPAKATALAQLLRFPRRRS